MAQTTHETELQGRIHLIKDSIAAASKRAGRRESDITLVAVSKTHPADLIKEAIQLGITEFGENRVQEAESKISEIGRKSLRWHLIGHLQANKARKAVNLFDVIHSIDSVTLVERLDALAIEAERSDLEVLVQVDLGGELTKSGAAPDQLAEIVDAVNSSESLRLTGLMTLPPLFDDPEQTRPYFRRLREIRDGLKHAGAFGADIGHLSMGMTNDFETAIEEGATMIRVGTALFGSRRKQTNIDG